MLGPCRYKPEQHQLIDPPLLDWCKRQAANPGDRDRLFIYRHTVAKTFVVGWWVTKNLWFVDLVNMGHSLNNFDRTKAQSIQRSLSDDKGIGKRLMAQVVGEAESSYLRRMQDQSLEKTDRARWQRRHVS